MAHYVINSSGHGIKISDDEFGFTEQPCKLETNLQNVLASLSIFKPPKVLKTTDSITLEWFSNACLIEIYINESDAYKWTITNFVHGTTFIESSCYTKLDNILEKELYKYFWK